MKYQIHKLTSKDADIFVVSANNNGYDYAYGGTRLMGPAVQETEVKEHLLRLAVEESEMKNRLINFAFASGACNEFEAEVPPGLLQSRVGGARCIIRPRDSAVYETLLNPASENLKCLVLPIFEVLGRYLDEQGGAIKLTPDFGRYAMFSDLLYQYTPNVLGIRREAGGCGGKSTYSSTGIWAGMEALNLAPSRGTRVTVIGAAGALGSQVLGFCQQAKVEDIAVCDLLFDAGISKIPEEVEYLKACRGKLTDECLSRGGTIIVTICGEGLENSNLEAIPDNTQLILAHNLCLPPGRRGKEIVQLLGRRNIAVIPGQVLTLGGALTSRLEWFSRQASREFNKPLAHRLVKCVIRFLMLETLRLSCARGALFCEALNEIANQPVRELSDGLSHI